jgi:bacterioferritin-associated ferredoxin
VIVCLCRGVSDSTIRAALDAGATTADDVARATGASTGCGCCRGAVEAIVRAHAAGASSPCAGCPRAAANADRRHAA